MRDRIMELIFEKSVEGRKGFRFGDSDVPVRVQVPAAYARTQDAPLPEVSELDVVRHYTRLSQMNFSIDTHFYPLGSCTMKYNPKFTEALARLSGFTDLHPLLAQLSGGERWTQGALQILYELQQWMGEITGFKHFTMQPLAGAHGELTGIMLMAAYHKSKGNHKKKYVIIPDSAHGTNPASAAIAGYETITIPSNKDGGMDLQALRDAVNEQTAGLMMTVPSTYGVFEPNISAIAEVIHAVDGIMYYDGANLNAVLGRFRPGDVGFDVMHINTHKTFTTPHGGGGPGAGPVGVNDKLAPFLPVSRVVRRADGAFALDYNFAQSIGYIASFYGNFGLLVRAYAYLLMLGREGLADTADHAVLNANYIMKKLAPYYKLCFDRICMHESVFSASQQAARGVHAIDIAKFLIDQQVHPPTVYFPISVPEAIMIEPTETESKQTMDYYIGKMVEADKLSQTDPAVFKEFPKTMPVSRPDEVKAARDVKTSFFAATTDAA
ncbi:MAG: aminomethyl-transferring glycine dehydrogenase subunit GcvPB [Candidatus Omnitrophica bacterium]|nr:aminomethyl-transferring glycine dehydrogenase subunit GcvPB [Candidatus Omnitrophota bacterium]MDE2214923.1 aminomethyl-transferring glycine dehydrogenase subunit GcvPB [Candidatus Omnitrophota bacterium]MDE2232272.1 aminomethyl-transferring glycine dehydrogenase subunit GcvPB [Candidatus Omnitrophota bacterium]